VVSQLKLKVEVRVNK